MTLFITGCESFVGQELIRQCDEKGITYIGIDAISSTNRFCSKADIRSKDIAELIPEGAEAIVHLAALSRDIECENNAYECFDINVMGTLNLIDACEKRDVKQFIFASTEWVYNSFEGETPKDENSFIDISKHTSEYALSKLVTESNLRQKYNRSFCDVTILRFGIIYGKRENNFSAVESIYFQVKNNNMISVGSLKTGRYFIHVKDIADGIIKSIGLKGFNIINLEGNKFVSLLEIIETAEDVVGNKVVVKESDPENISIRNVSNQKAKKILRWNPDIDLNTGIKYL